MISLSGYEIKPTNDGDLVLLRTDRGEIGCLLMSATGADTAVLWAGSLSAEDRLSPIARSVAKDLREDGVSSLAVRYRRPFELEDSVQDTLAALLFFRQVGVQRVALVGHSFSGAVAIAAAPLSEAVVAVAALASQTYGARNVANIAPRPLLLVHGTADQRLDPYCSEQIYSWAKKPKELVLIEGATHGLSEHPEFLLPLLRRWLTEKLRPPADQ
ncbi:MAG TPA: alpha/beta hydrolase [Dehalococcoidia bacterium]|nr:alpha/beta hydrolase [Dehalococcoidia bacterium]